MDPYAVEESRRKIEDLYHTKGYSQVRVTLLEGSRIGDRGVVFLIDEGPKQRLMWIEFKGNTIASGERLKTVIESRALYPWLFTFFASELDRKKIDEDINRLTAYYRGLGFFRRHVGRELETNENGTWITLTFVIDEGPRYQVRNVLLNGNKMFGTPELTEKLKLKPGMFFNQAQMVADLRRIKDKYGRIGHVFAKADADTQLILEEPGKVDLVYKIAEGAAYRVGNINVAIKGDPARTKLTAVLNQISLYPGDLIDTQELRDSERRMKFSQLFETDPRKGTRRRSASTRRTRRPRSPATRGPTSAAKARTRGPGQPPGIAGSI